ncbi:glycosyltransferase family 2 protein [Nodosilinea sp. LEGE 07088]|uniref:glycosyltransferase n=1 Tax=Nodosilinea sp. LEGE 07088 TaxID=2777968 RepID=UPI00187ECE50|nr:glycosyltransferase family A protein [Nodosilinea sp. LEGE 07088]MBE9139440.1 glycosyltransferase family 2 protein [Nodosilinea sp. LEGE 07088]
MQPESHSYFVSVIIPVFNDAERLQVCLMALAKQTFPRDRYEILVVDNGSSDDIQSVVDQFPGATLAYEAQPGSYRARNLGITLAQGEILAFTDSDCTPAPDWLEIGVAKLLNLPNAGLVAGRVELYYQNPNRPTAVELFDSMSFLQQKDYVEQDHFGATANLFTFKTVVEAVGPFNTSMKSGGDAEWGNRVYDQGYSVAYAEDSWVAHPTRQTWGQLYKKVVRITGGGYDLHTQQRRRLNLRVWLKLLQDLKPPLRTALQQINGSHRLTTSYQKIQVLGLIYAIYYVKVWTRLRLQLGYSSQRQ